MKLMIVIKVMFVLLSITNIYSQDCTYKKKDIFFILKEDTNCLDHYKDKFVEGYDYKNNVKFKIFKNDGIMFNLYCEHAFLQTKSIKFDTLSIDSLKNFKISTHDDVEKLVKEFRRKTYKKFPKHKNEKLYQAYNNNDLFNTFLIEILNDKKKIVIYPVIWRNQDIIE